jgi:uncharacterized repeat protein (TIGR03803 family)
MGFGCGTVFKIDTSGNETVLHSFNGKDGYQPQADLLLDSSGNLYGTTAYGGNPICDNGGGCGTVFKVGTGGKLTVLHAFAGNDGGNSTASLIMDAAGNLYGTTAAGGNGNGVVFKLSQTGETVLHMFTSGSDGAQPHAALVRDPAGNLYGTTLTGGSTTCSPQCGTIFEVGKFGTETVLYRFRPGRANDGGIQPFAPLIAGGLSSGYGTTAYGGDYFCQPNNRHGCGTVYKFDATGETRLYAFSGGADGAWPFGGLVRDAAGNLYGTASIGGDLSCPAVQNQMGCGTIFKVDPSGNFTVLHTFMGSDGASPEADLHLDAAGNLYGTTYGGGDLSCSSGAGCGTVFKLTLQ